jgi:hypothetical protein
MDEQVGTTASAEVQVGQPVVEKPRRQRKPRAQKPQRKPRIAAGFRLLERVGDATWRDLGVAAGNTMDAAHKALKACAAGEYWIVRSYVVRTVAVESVPRVTIR